MDIAHDDSTAYAAPSEERARAWQRLFHRWFVEYNPLYLLSAALVLAGCILWSNGLARQDSVAGQLGVDMVAELYALSLVGGAALLTRIGLRRPAVLLALLFILYQWDSTLHTETCAYLGAAGAWAAALWFLLFVAKLYALAWALKIRFARRAAAAAFLAAAGLALGPRVLPPLGGRDAGALLAVWIFALFALYRPGAISSTVDLDAWGRTVLRRATRAAWLLSGALVGMHVLMWWRDHDIRLGALLLAAPIFLVARLRSEGRVWATALATLVVAAAVQPGAFFVVALLIAAALGLRAFAPAFAAAPDVAHADAAASSPYRAGPGALGMEDRPSIHLEAAAVIDAGERARLLTGSIFAAYLAAWTARWSHGAWPSHVLALDIALTAAVALVVWRKRWRLPLTPLFLSYAHFVVAESLIPVPRTSIAWGETVIAIGFALLGGSLFTSFRFRAYAHPGTHDSGDAGLRARRQSL